MVHQSAKWLSITLGLLLLGARAPATENRLDRDAEERNREARERWIESLHTAGPGVDWRAIEEANRAAHLLERQVLEAGGQRTAAWQEIGSANQAGRTHVTVLDPSGNGRIFVGTDLGGLWEGTIEGTSWTPLSDDLGGAVHQAMFSPGAPEVLTVATDGGALHTSTNGGDTWFVPAGLPEYVYKVNRILRDPVTPRRIYLLLRGRRWYNDAWDYAYFLLRSENGGQSYAVVNSFSTGTPPDMWISRTIASPLYVMAGATMKRSTDFGATFSDLGTAPASVSDLILTGSEAGSPTFYAAIKSGANWNLWSSTNGGGTWTNKYPISDFWGSLNASITNSNTVLFGGVEVWRSTDGGANFWLVNPWWAYYDNPLHRLHADIPGLESAMHNGTEVMFIDTDGGTFVSYDRAATVTNISMQGLGISQYYDIFTSATDPYLVAAGAQDQGYQQSIPSQGVPYLHFDQLISGDYGHLTSAHATHDMLYSTYPGFTLLQTNEAAPQDLQMIDFPPATYRSWLPNILADPADDHVYYLCADHLWRCEQVSGSVYTNTALPQSFADGAGHYATALAISPANYQHWYVVTDHGNLWYSHDGGTSWTVSASPGPGAHYFYGSDLLPSPTDANVCYAAGSGYSNPAVYKTTDGGATWTAMGDGLPSTLVFSLAFDNALDQNLFAAAEAGPYRYMSDMGRWVDVLGTDAPVCTYWTVEGVPALGVVRFGTYGRGIWDYTVPATTALAMPAEGPHLRVYPNPAGEHAVIEYAAQGAGPVSVEVFNVQGQRLASLKPQSEGRVVYDLRADSGGALANGMYLVRLTAGVRTAVEQLRVVR